jgi:hypothetical protein
VSTLTRLSAAQLQLAEVLATPCASCGHSLKFHPFFDRPCRHHDVKPHASKDPEKAKIVYCNCKGFADAEPSAKLFAPGERLLP